jgi:hypothetical protein
MFSLLDKPEYFDERAAQVMVRLQETLDPDVREILQRLHEEYLRLAQAAAERASKAKSSLSGKAARG